MYMDMYSIAASGMTAQRTEMDVIAMNLANASTTRTDSGGPYQARSVVLQSSDAFSNALDDAFSSSPLQLASEEAVSFGPDWDTPDDAVAPQGVRVSSIIERPESPQYRYDPGNAGAYRSGPRKGYVQLSNVDPIQEMVALVAAGRNYDADVSMLQTAKQMDLAASDIARM